MPTTTEATQSFTNVITGLQSTFGINHTIFILIIVLILLPFMFFITWRTTGRSLISFITTGILTGFLILNHLLPIWIGAIFVVFLFPFIAYSVFYVSREKIEKQEPIKKRRVYKNKILCKFIHDDGSIIEKWVDNKEQFAELTLRKYFISPKNIELLWSGKKFYPVIYYKVNNSYPVDLKQELEKSALKDEVELDKRAREVCMVNQLIQDPNKSLKDIPTGSSATVTISARTSVYSQKDIDKHGSWINTSINENFINFDSISFPRGTKILTKLNTTHSQALDIFSGDLSQADNLIDVTKMKALELDIYNHGINVLKQVYEIASQLQQTKIDELNETHTDLTTKLATLDKSSPMYSLMNDRLDINNKSLGMIKKYNDRTDELLCQVDLYIESISEMCLELPELINHQAQGDMDAKIRELNNRIAMAQRIKDEYNKEKI